LLTVLYYGLEPLTAWLRRTWSARRATRRMAREDLRFGVLLGFLVYLVIGVPVRRTAMNQSDPGVKQGWVTLQQAMAQPIPRGERSAPVLAHGSMLVKYYAPRESDQQTPHIRDELYVVVRGSGWFVNGDRRHPFSVGDLLFVPAGVPHRFEDFTDDFGTWVVFYGPEGGERPREAHRVPKGPESPHA
jgi:mannose-6-phosphate isomerase-like protein (cupin superfamily)